MVCYFAPTVETIYHRFINLILEGRKMNKKEWGKIDKEQKEAGIQLKKAVLSGCSININHNYIYNNRRNGGHSSQAPARYDHKKNTLHVPYLSSKYVPYDEVATIERAISMVQGAVKKEMLQKWGKIYVRTGSKFVATI